MTSALGPALSGGVPPLFSLEPWGPVFPFLQPEGSGSFLRGRARAAHAGQVQAAASEPRRYEQELGAGAWGPSSVHSDSLPSRPAPSPGEEGLASKASQPHRDGSGERFPDQRLCKLCCGGSPQNAS